ncbi:hypothetical protein BVX98_06940 [bacterium F11]|nr:hypothetical protein BVX98_06940 [bacterium F11]
MKILSFLIIGVGLLFSYLALSENWEWKNWILGGFLSLFMLALIQVRLSPFQLHRLPIRLWSLLKYLLYLIWDVFDCGINTAKIVLSPKLPIRPGVVRINDTLKSKAGKALSAHSLTLTPGDVLMETDEEGMFYVHSLDVDQTEKDGNLFHQRRMKLIKDIVPED